MTDDLNRLRAAAEAATPGPWVLSSDNVVTEDTGEYIIADWMDDENRAFIATFDPPTVLALLDRIADYENGISWGTSCISCAKTLDSSYAEYVRADKAEADLATLRAAITNLADNLSGYIPSSALGSPEERSAAAATSDHWERNLRSRLAAAPTETEGENK